MTAEREALADRVRAALPQEHSIHERSTFGGLSFMVDDRMVVMGSDRPMGPGWIRVSRDGLTTDEQLVFWIGAGLDHHSTQAETLPD